MAENEYPKHIPPPALIEELAGHVGGTITECAVLPDGSGFATMSMPLPTDHWLYADDGTYDAPPMPLRMGTEHADRQAMNEKVRAAARYAIRASTMKGKEIDFDPDAMVQNFVVGLLGYHTPDGLSSDTWANPSSPIGAASEASDASRDVEIGRRAIKILREFIRQERVTRATYATDIGLATAADHALVLLHEVDGKC